jgi:3-dehydroquinate synthase
VSDFSVRTSIGSYRVSIRAGSFPEVIAPGRCTVVLADRFFAMALANVELPVVFVDADETHKNLYEADRILAEFSDRGLTRGGSLVAVGGGIVQDLGTFTASVYMRGVPWTYVPTTLMAMADSCIGGKSSLNVSGTKNLAGNIYPPAAVVVDPEFIASLSEEDVAAGLGEAVKIAFCGGAAAFERYLHDAADMNNWEPLIEGVLLTKKRFIEVDEFDRGERRLLNFGHTFGHALEAATAFSVGHGVAVIVGMLAASSFRRLHLADGATHRALREYCRSILERVPDLGSRLVDADLEVFRAAFLKDKKHPPDGLRLILPKADEIGVEEVSLPRSAEVLGAVQSALSEAVRETM